MYPFLRLFALTVAQRRKPALAPFDTHHLPMTCLPWDIDGFVEMNNGRILTLFDLGRFGLSIRTGLWDTLKRERWGLVVAGSSVRYRARIRPFQRFDIRTRLLGWDDKFIYLEQAMVRGETVCNHALLRTGVTEKGRLIDPLRVADALGLERTSPPLPAWVEAWARADRTRPWPPKI
ncbi:Mesenchymal stem cell protein DSCD75 [Roseibacterium elongatum DSM 19469]|uniref:Mesenchymal stem cell protein DSCD75 n=1 Tax=Roseicyclus elongatus DSM 19469 TaxID=1294273 RepID=W8RQG9_9RHOB|nr:acyl-CoA thioesterase [Roseibacterium elongatum]AHM03318.1 Mesenchymal stem cell protein DSCD75 [Roseibacterium elongatum DSM 19469]